MSEEHRIILVTGSNKGIGYELVRLLAQRRHTVYLAARNEALGKEAQARLKKEHNLDVKFIKLDVTNVQSVKAAVETIERNEGRLDVLVNNAGVSGGDSIHDAQPAATLTEAAIRQTFSVNFDGLVNATTAFLPLLRKSKPGYGAILNVSSVLASNALQVKLQNDLPLHVTAYNASKAAANTYSIILSWELQKEPSKVKVNSVHPGYVKTDMTKHDTYGITPEDGAKVLLPWALLGPQDETKTGLFYGPDGEIPW